MSDLMRKIVIKVNNRSVYSDLEKNYEQYLEYLSEMNLKMYKISKDFPVWMEPAVKYSMKKIKSVMKNYESKP